MVNPANQIATATVFSSVVATDTAYYVSGIFSDSLPPYALGLTFSKLNLGGDISKQTLYYMTSAKSFGNWANTLITSGSEFFNIGTFFIDKVQSPILTNLDSDGTVAWQKIYPLDTPPNGQAFGIGDLLNVFRTPESIYISCNSSRSVDSTDMGIAPNLIWLTKTDMLGNRIWSKSYGNPNKSHGTVCINEMSMNGILLAYGEFDLNVNSWGAFSGIRMIVLDSAGNYIRNFYNSDRNTDILFGVRALIRTRDNGYAYAGSKGWWQQSQYPYDVSFKGILVKIDSNGHEAWRYLNQGDSSSAVSCEMTSAIETSDGNIIAAGNMISLKTTDSAHLYMSMAKLSADGALQWERKYTHFSISDASISQENFSVKECPDKGFILCGRSENDAAVEGWLVKTDSFGCLVTGCQIWDGVEKVAVDSMEMLLYPNPTSHSVNFIVHSVSHSQYTLSINDMGGKTIFRHSIQSDVTNMLNTNGFASGDYILSVEDERGYGKQQKLIISK